MKKYIILLVLLIPSLVFAATITEKDNIVYSNATPSVTLMDTSTTGKWIMVKSSSGMTFSIVSESDTITNSWVFGTNGVVNFNRGSTTNINVLDFISLALNGTNAVTNTVARSVGYMPTNVLSEAAVTSLGIFVTNATQGAFFTGRAFSGYNTGNYDYKETDLTHDGTVRSLAVPPQFGVIKEALVVVYHKSTAANTFVGLYSNIDGTPAAMGEAVSISQVANLYSPSAFGMVRVGTDNTIRYYSNATGSDGSTRIVRIKFVAGR